MGQQQSYVIIGNGIAGITAAEILRTEDALCSITIIADDPLPASYRPALKDYLGGHLQESKLWARPNTFHQDQRIRFIPGRGLGINTTQRFVERRDGSDVRTEEEIAEIVGKNGQVAEVITTRGKRIPCEMVLIAIGIEPLIDFIRASGIACGRGVKVDNGMHTNFSDIYAAGDVVETTDEFTGRTRVLGQWFPAIQQAQIAAYNMLGLLSSDHPFYPGSGSSSRAAFTNYYNATFLYGLDFVSVGLTTHLPSADYQ